MSLHSLPAHSRLWLLALESLPDRQAQAQLRRGLDEIMAQWRHKGQVYQGAALLLEPQLIAVAEPSLAAQPSGCAIDGMLRKVRRLVEDQHLRLMDPAASILVRLGDRLTVVAKADLQARLDEGTLDGHTPVLDLSLYSLEELRAGRLDAPLAATWVGRKYNVSVDA
ncbi:MAG: hypothetical protein P4L36_19265 [Holophaga sp.]|nr:hypothetical protein [Holophaga sp.]